MSDRQIVIYVAATIQRAHLLKNLLEDVGIEATVVNEYSSVGALRDGDRAQVIVSQKDRRAADKIAGIFDEQIHNRDSEDESPFLAEDFGMATRETPEPIVPWPTCPSCRKPRITACPYCKTSGEEFPRAHGQPDHDQFRQPAATDEEDLSDAPVLFVVCPHCDEPFLPPFYRHCTWCDHDFGSGLEIDEPFHGKRSAPPEAPLNPRVTYTILALLVLLGVMTAYFTVVVTF